MRLFGAIALALWALLALVRAEAWPAWGAAALWACALGAIAARPLSSRVPRALVVLPAPIFVGVCALIAAGVSYFCVRRHLHATPLAIDSAVYEMQARALAHGAFGVPIPEPAQAFGGHFLFEGADGRMHGVFPPGWPLFLAAFVAAKAPMLAGPAVAALGVLAQYALGRAVGGRDGEAATRASLLFALPSFARAMETADLLSHAFVGVLATTAIGAALRYCARPSRALAAAIGACVAWAFASRLLDGVVVAIVAAAIVAGAQKRPLVFAIAAALPFLVFLAADQRAATGSFTTPTQTAYFARADWPPTCHRLGFGADVGCNVEHPDAVERDGADGYTPDDAVRVMRERAGTLGEDLFGFAPLALLAFVPLLRRATRGDAACAAFAIALTLAYGLFYYGNATAFGARHLFPAASFFWLLAARALADAPYRARGWLDEEHARGAALLAAICAIAIAARPTWIARGKRIDDYHGARADLARVLSRHAIDRGILKSRDEAAVIAAFDPYDRDRIVVADDRSGLVELRRAHPDFPLFLGLPNDEVGRIYTPPAPAPGLLLEFERAWPSFVRPRGLGVRPHDFATASGGAMLDVAWSREGASLDVPFDVVEGGRFALRVDGVAGPDQADWSIAIDGAPLATWRGFAARRELRRGDATVLDLARGRHTLTARCVGRAPESSGWLGAFDALVGEPAQ